MTDISEVAKKYNIIMFRYDDDMKCATHEDVEAFANHYRKEGAEEANKTIEELKQQLAATELVLEQVRDAAHNLEVSANSVIYCYSKRPENFASALVQLGIDAEAYRMASELRAKGDK